MASVAFERVRAKIKSEAARILMTDLKDPRMGFVTVIDVDLSRGSNWLQSCPPLQ